MSAHTPGPWRFSHGDIWPTGRGPRIAHLNDWVSVDRYKANAALIAAAPDLLAALEGMLLMVEKVLTDSQLDHVHCGQTIRVAIDPARATIARAKGAE